MWAKRIVFICIITLLLNWSTVAAQPVYAVEIPAPNVLITYTNDSEQENIIKMNNLMGHFHLHIRVDKLNKVPESDWRKFDYIVYLDSGDESGREQLERRLVSTDVPLLWIGAGDKNLSLSAISFTYQSRFYQVGGASVNEIRSGEQDEILATASNGVHSAPLILKNKNRWYIMSTQMSGAMGYLIADLLHDFLNTPHDNRHQGFIMIQNVNPKTSTQKLYAIADALSKRKIPFLVAVTPIYTYSLTSTHISIEEEPDFINALHYLKDRGGHFILNGLTHQYKHTATGNSYEFWDAIEDVPIADEEKVVKDKLERGIALLIKHKLFPVGFEPPLYAMSQQGYQILGNYFSAIYGRLQVSDRTYENVQEVPYILERNSHSLKLYPENLGHPTDQPGDVEEMMSNLAQLKIVRDAFYGVLFNTDSSIALLEQMLDSLEDHPIDFMNPANQLFHVRTSSADIKSDGYGELKVSITDPNELIRLTIRTDTVSSWLPSFTYILTWGIAIVVGVFILLFVCFLFLLNRRKRYRLFAERTLAANEWE
ncbi:MAG: hypothetical protein K0S39_1652 [Paenibacillus sp.]|jgi:uncharacterized protein YdaL|nr:hypothetical protein [Paenibacillus sp.]